MMNKNIEMMIRFNNQGAFLIECGNYKKAIQCLLMGNHMLVKEMENTHLIETSASSTSVAGATTSVHTDTGTTIHSQYSRIQESRPILTFDVTRNSKKCRDLLEGHQRHCESSNNDINCDSALSSNSLPHDGPSGFISGPLEEHSRNSPTSTGRRLRRSHSYYYDHDGGHGRRRGGTFPIATRGRPPRHSGATTSSSNSRSNKKETAEIMTKRMMGENEEEEPFISRRPIRISCLPSERGDFCLSVIFLFNLALAHQLLARSFSSTSMAFCTANKQSLPKTATTMMNHKNNNSNNKMMHVTTQRERNVRASLYFYQCAFTMKNKGNLHFDTSFALAMVNNTAHVLLELGYKQRAKKLQQLMLSTLMMVVVENTKKMDDYDSQQVSSSSSSIILDDMEGFMATATQSMVSKEEQTTAMIA